MLENPKEAWGRIPNPITKDNLQNFKFAQFRKKTIPTISEFTVPPGYAYETPEGLKSEDEDTRRIAIDSQGGVYPIRESVFQETYERV